MEGRPLRGNSPDEGRTVKCWKESQVAQDRAGRDRQGQAGTGRDGFNGVRARPSGAAWAAGLP